MYGYRYGRRSRYYGGRRDYGRRFYGRRRYYRRWY